MNTPLTRIQSFEVLALCAILLFGAVGILILSKASTADDSGSMRVAHGIETTWRSETGGERLWSLSGNSDFRPWLDEHIAAVKEAQQVLPIKEK